MAVPCMHVPHSNPYSNLRTGTDAGVLLKEWSARDMKVDAEEVGFKVCTAGNGCFHI